MKPKFLIIWVLVIFSFFSLQNLQAQSALLDNFESVAGWELIKSEAFAGNISLEPGKIGKAIRFDYDFTRGMGFGGIQKWFPLEIPENYELSFWIKAESPSNTLEIKFIDESGDNVWWVNKRNYNFPTEWTQVRIRPRHVSFAWGPATDRILRRADRIEFTVASFVGGKGTIWIDDLRFEELPPRPAVYPQPVGTASSARRGNAPALALDNNAATSWQSRKAGRQHYIVDFATRREFGGIHIDWVEQQAAKRFDVLLSNDGKNWEKVYSVAQNRS
ncbi:MAG TPA: discoidin domain-containing protein, partial [Bacteroidales bacterium]|nr:discoidin domain-containing protein [Bacteroidales bacterium]